MQLLVLNVILQTVTNNNFFHYIYFVCNLKCSKSVDYLHEFQVISRFEWFPIREHFIQCSGKRPNIRCSRPSCIIQICITFDWYPMHSKIQCRQSPRFIHLFFSNLLSRFVVFVQSRITQFYGKCIFIVCTH